MLYTIFIYEKGAGAPRLERTGDLTVARMTAVDYSKDAEVIKVVVKNNENGNTATYQNGIIT